MTLSLTHHSGIHHNVPLALMAFIIMLLTIMSTQHNVIHQNDTRHIVALTIMTLSITPTKKIMQFFNYFPERRSAECYCADVVAPK
jgi:hypothetical protein